MVALLVNAHYQTRPSDLRQLLDNPDGELWLASAGGEVLGVLLGVLEGGFDAPMAGQVLAAQRRPRGHLLAQSLAVHAGLDDCLTQRVLRVQRIAVHPQRRRGGIGSRLLDAAGAWAADNAVDLLGCAFGVELPLLAFWQDAGMRAVRLGLRVDPASATHSLFMLRALSVRGEALVAVAVRRFLGDMPWALGGSLRDIDSQLALALMAGRDCSDLALNDDECRDLARIVAGARQPATAEALVWKCIVTLAAAARAHDEDLAALLAWRLQHQPIGFVCRHYSISGRKALEALLRDRLANLTQPPAMGG